MKAKTVVIALFSIACLVCVIVLPLRSNGNREQEIDSSGVPPEKVSPNSSKVFPRRPSEDSGVTACIDAIRSSQRGLRAEALNRKLSRLKHLSPDEITDLLASINSNTDGSQRISAINYLALTLQRLEQFDDLFGLYRALPQGDVRKSAISITGPKLSSAQARLVLEWCLSNLLPEEGREALLGVLAAPLDQASIMKILDSPLLGEGQEGASSVYAARAAGDRGESFAWLESFFSQIDSLDGGNFSKSEIAAAFLSKQLKQSGPIVFDQLSGLSLSPTDRKYVERKAGELQFQIRGGAEGLQWAADKGDGTSFDFAWGVSYAWARADLEGFSTFLTTMRESEVKGEAIKILVKRLNEVGHAEAAAKWEAAIKR